MERVEVLVEQLAGRAQRVGLVEVEDVADAVEDEGVDLALAARRPPRTGLDRGHQAALLPARYGSSSSSGITSFSRADSDSRSIVQTGSHTTCTSTASTSSSAPRALPGSCSTSTPRTDTSPLVRTQCLWRRASRSGGRPPPRPCRRSRCRVSRSRGHRPPSARRSASECCPLCTPPPGRWRCGSRWCGWRGLDRRPGCAPPSAPSRCRGTSRPLTIPQRLGRRSETHSQTLPASCSAPNGRRAVRVRGDRHGPAHETPRRSCSRSRRTWSPQDRARASRSARERLPLTGGRGRARGRGTTTEVHNASASASVTSVAGGRRAGDRRAWRLRSR